MTQVTDEMVEAFLFAHGGVRDGLQALFDAKLISLPVDEAAIRESVVREAIAMIPERVPQCNSTFDDAWNSVIDTLNREFQSLLPTKDRAKELAEAYIGECEVTKDHELDVNERMRVLHFARWLIEREGGGNG